MAMRQPVGEPVQTWTERRLVVRSVRQAQAAAAARPGRQSDRADYRPPPARAREKAL